MSTSAGLSRPAAAVHEPGRWPRSRRIRPGDMSEMSSRLPPGSPGQVFPGTGAYRPATRSTTSGVAGRTNGTPHSSHFTVTPHPRPGGDHGGQLQAQRAAQTGHGSRLSRQPLVDRAGRSLAGPAPDLQHEHRALSNDAISSSPVPGSRCRPPASTSSPSPPYIRSPCHRRRACSAPRSYPRLRAGSHSPQVPAPGVTGSPQRSHRKPIIRASTPTGHCPPGP